MAKTKHDPDPLVRSALPPDEPSGAAGDTPPPPHAAPTPVDPAAGPLPRVVPELARAVPGTTRWKVRVNNYGEQGNDHKYVLTAAGDEEAAKACFLKATNLDEYVARIKRNAGSKADEVESPAFVCVALKD